MSDAPWLDAELDAEDRAFLYGDGLFETIRVREDGARWLDAHLQRLQRSAMSLGFDPAQIARAQDALRGVVRHGAPGLWRVTMSRASPDAPFGGTGCVRARFRPYQAPTARPRLTLSPGLYCPGDSLALHKSCSAMRYSEARRRARARGFDDALLSDDAGRAGEASAASVLWVDARGALCAPPLEGILRGVTREGALALLKQRGVAVALRALTRAQLDGCQELILLSAGLGAMSAASLEGRALEASWGPRLAQWLEQVARAKPAV